MPVSPIPCAPGGEGAAGSCSCSPSIATTPLCRADGTTVLVVVRSECVDCGDPAADPAAIGWVDPATGAYTAGPAPADAGPCAQGCSCSPSIATTPLCRADGTSVLVVVRSDCTDCDTPGADPVVVGWLDPLTGVFTPGAAPTDVVPCEALTCVDTVCRQRCDDTNGDGEADATYSELWCIRADGTAELVLTYQDDPSLPYTPTAPVDCTYGCPETETVQLCDDSGPFLRRYTWLSGTATFEDFALDGTTAHVVTGAVGVCPAAPDCEAQTTPAATLGLCLADGTPIAVVVTRDCSGTVTQDGWLNLTTGAYSAGDPPLGTVACGSPRSISTTGTFCDVDPDTGDVLGLVLIEYTYGPEGEVAAVRLVDATTGQTYVPQGEVTTCPAGVEQPERDLTQLCDTATDGAVTAFVRDYARDETGTITGHSDYLLDGTPYTPAGTVGRCVDQCHDCETFLLCDTVASPPVTIAGTAASGTLSNGVGYAVTAPNPFSPGRQSDGAAWWGVAVFPNSTTPLTRWTFDQPVNVDFSVAMTWSASTATPGENQVQVPPGAVPLSLPAGYTYNQTTGILRVDNTLTGCTLNQPTRAQSARFRLVGVTTFTLQYLGTRVLNAACQRFGTWEFGALDVSLGSEFLRTVCRDCTGTVTSTTDTLLDGTTPYAPLGLVGVCQPTAEEAEEEPCRDTYTTQVCDLPTGEATGAPTATDTSATPYPWDADPIRCVNQHPGGGAALWSGGTVTIPARASGAGGCSPNQWLAGLAATLQAPRPSCDSGTVTVTVSVAARNQGPAAAAVNYAGSLRIHRTDTGARLADSGSALGGTPAGTSRTMTATAVNVPAGLLAAGQIVVALDVESWDQTGNTGAAWQLSDFVAAFEFQQDGCETQFLRKIVTDCETGATISVTDTTLDGDPYTVTGQVGQCTTIGGGSETCCDDTEVVTLCNTGAGGEVTPFLRHLTYPEGGGTPTIRDTLLDGTEYVPDGEVGTCTADAAEPCRDFSSTLLCDTAAQAALTVFDPAARPGSDGWQVVSFTGANSGFGPQAALPYDAPHPVTGFMGARSDLQAGSSVSWTGYDTAPVRWVLRKTFTAPEDGIAAVSSIGFRGDGGARVRVNGIDAGMYGQWNQPATAGTAQIPVTAGTNTVEIEVRDVGGQNWVQGRLDIAMTRTVQFMRRTVVDCETGETVSVVDTTLDGDPYTVTGEVGQCDPVAECCEPPPPEARVDVETALLCVLDEASGEITGQVIAERVYDDQSGALAEQRLTSLDGDPYTLPADAVLTACQSTPEGRDVELTPLCVVDNATGNVIQRILAEVIYDTATGERLSVRYVDPLTWGPVAVPGGTHFDLCPEGQPDPVPDVEVVQLCDLVDGEEPAPFLRHLAYLPGATAPTVADTALDGVTPYVLTGTAGVCSEPCAVQAVIEACRCDDTDGDGLPDTGYVELLGVDCDGQLTSLGTYTDGLAEPYAPVSPVDCATVDDGEGADPAHGVQARRVDLAAGASWDAAAVPTLQSVTAVAHSGTGTITTADGPSMLRPEESVTWSVTRDVDAALTGPLTITAVTGTVTVSWTEGVTL
jgi:hypothetical protein